MKVFNAARALTGLLLLVTCVKSEERRCAVTLMFAEISVALVLMMRGIIAFTLVFNFLQ